MNKKFSKLIKIITPIFLIFIAAIFFYSYAKSREEQKSAQEAVISGESGKVQSNIEAAQKTKTTFAFAGDMMFDRNVWHRYKDIGMNRIFDNFDTLFFKNSDIAFANLEGPISSVPINDDYASGSMVFNFPPETVETLRFLGLNGVSLANNHTLNAGVQGFSNTKNVLLAAGIKYGGSQNDYNADNIIRYDEDHAVSIIVADILAEIDPEEITQSVAAESANGRFVVVYPHWGVEYEGKHNLSQERMAESWIDAGADIIIGGHPHVTQDVEIYKNRPIIYSLGNFVFDQFFSKETQRGLLISGSIEGSNLTVKISPYTSTGVKPKLDEGSEKLARLKAIFPNDEEFNALKISEDTIKFDLKATEQP